MMNLSDFYQTFFDEADELLTQVELNLLALDPAHPDSELLNAIFRAAHSIKGGAATFGFTHLQETTHLLENLLDSARSHQLALNEHFINVFLETKDIMQDQLDAYKNSETPNQQRFTEICQTLQAIAKENQLSTATEPAGREPLEKQTLNPDPISPPAQPNPAPSPTTQGQGWQIKLSKLKAREAELLLEELSNLGTVLTSQVEADTLTAELETELSQADIAAVLCFVINEDQIVLQALESPSSDPRTAAPTDRVVLPPSPAIAPEASPVSAPQIIPPSADKVVASVPAPLAKPNKPSANEKNAPKQGENSMRVSVEKVDQLINLVGELIITQSMLAQSSSKLDSAEHSELLNTIALLERGAKDLQESAMSIRMVPMEFVFSRFPRLVRQLSEQLDKKIELILLGGDTELDKSLIEKIIDPLTHLIRNSIDHGVESAAQRLAHDKPETGHITLSASHRGGHIYIEVIDDGAGLNKEKILKKARDNGLTVNEEISDNEIYNLIFAPGFSTAEQVSEVSGRGVGMDVVRRNIHEMGGHVDIESVAGQGTTIRIVLPLTLAILYAMSVKVADEIFIIPVNMIMEALQPAAENIYTIANGERVLQVRGEYLPIIELNKIFNIAGAKDDITQGIAVIVQSDRHRYALFVDQLIGQQQVVVKNLETNYRKVQGISGATILGDGSVSLILDIAGLQVLHQQSSSPIVAA